MHPTADLDAAAVSHLPCVCHGIQLSVVRVVAGRRGFPAPRRAESNGRFGLLFLLLALRDQSLGEACQVVVDRVGGLLWRRRGVHARAQSLLDRRAAPPVVTGRRPASCGRGRGGGKEKVGCQPSCLSRATKTTGGRGPFDLGIGIPNTEDMTVRQGFGTGRSGWRTRSTRSGGSRIGLRFVILSWVEGSWSCGSACCVAATSLWHRGGGGEVVGRPSVSSSGSRLTEIDWPRRTRDLGARKISGHVLISGDTPTTHPHCVQRYTTVNECVGSPASISGAALGGVFPFADSSRQRLAMIG